MNDNTNGGVYIDPTKFYYVPTPQVDPNGWPTYPVYPTPQSPCPGCGRCPVCGKPGTPHVTITYGKTMASSQNQ